METTLLTGAIRRLEENPSFAEYLACAKALDERDSVADLPSLRVGVLRNFTIEPLIPVLKGEIARGGFRGEFYLGDYDVLAQEALDRRSRLYTFQPDFILLAIWPDTFAPRLYRRFAALSAEQAAEERHEVLARVIEIVEAIRRETAAPVLLNNFPLPRYRTLGILDAQGENHQVSSIWELNRELTRYARQQRDLYLVDFLSVMAETGVVQAVDERYWQVARAPLGRAVLLPLAQEYGAFVRALRGKTRKCLVLDCDNTLWGGIVGEEGLRGIRLGDTYPGSAYRAFQEEILNLYHRGVILALCSKNDEAAVVEVLRGHPGMLLKEEHFATWEINWNDKATNLRRIAKNLNIGLDSLVFVDDSPFECAQVRELLPEVAVVHVAGEPAEYSALLARRHYFDSLTLSDEDRRRNQMYRQEVQRTKLREAAGSLEDYLGGLNIVAKIADCDPATVPRAAQLTQKTNQFNLTTRRYTEGEIQAYLNRSDADVLFVRVRDRLDDLGIVGVAIVLYEGEEAWIDTFLLSCRVLGRGVEDALLASVLNRAAERKCTAIRGCYIPSAKNGQVADFYKSRGFVSAGLDGGGETWRRSLSAYPFPTPRWITLDE